MPKYYLHHAGLEPLEIECSEETASLIRAVIDHLDTYPVLLDEEENEDLEEDD